MKTRLLCVACFAVSACSVLPFGAPAPNRESYQIALMELKSQAAAGNAYYQDKLGMLYDEGLNNWNGLNVPKNYRLAMKWFLAAAAQGDPDADENIGMMYLKGEGVTQDSRVGHEFLRLASQLRKDQPEIAKEAAEVEAKRARAYANTPGSNCPFPLQDGSLSDKVLGDDIHQLCVEESEQGR